MPLHVRIHLLLSVALLVCPAVAQADIFSSEETAPAHHFNPDELPGTPEQVRFGGWSHAIPIEVPRGPGGLSPELALVADTRTVDGPLGVGWALSGFSSIERRTVSGAAPDPDLQSSFWVDGTELVLMTPAVGAQPARYRPETDDNRRFDYHPLDDHWTAHRDGWTWAFGVNPLGGGVLATEEQDERVCSDASSGDSSSDSDSTTAAAFATQWHLAYVLDPHGNSIEVDYTTSCVCPAGPLLEDNYACEHLPSTVDWADGHHRLSLNWEERPDWRVDAESGVLRLLADRLESIEVIVDALGSATTDRTYEVDWKADAGPTNLSVVEGVELVGVGASRTLATVVTDATDTSFYAAEDVSAELAALDSSLDPDTAVSPYVVNFDGDGDPDLAVLMIDCDLYIRGLNASPGQACRGSWKVYENYAADYGASASPNTSYLAEADPDWNPRRLVSSGFLEDKGRFLFVDLDRDGRTDVVGPEVPCDEDEDGNTGAGVTCPGAWTFDLGSDDFEERTDWIDNGLPNHFLEYGRTADVNGDGWMDLVVLPNGAYINTYWVPNRGEAPYWDQSDAQVLVTPLSIGGVASAELQELRAGAIAGTCDDSYPQDPFRSTDQDDIVVYDEEGNLSSKESSDTDTDSSDQEQGSGLDFDSAEQYYATQSRMADVNGDGIADLAYAFYTCWGVDHFGMYAPEPSGGAFSRIYYGDGQGGFTDTGESAGAPFLRGIFTPIGDEYLAEAYAYQWISWNTFSTGDFDGDGHVELIHGHYEGDQVYDFSDETDLGSLQSSSTVSLSAAPDRGVVDGFGLITDETLVDGVTWDEESNHENVLPGELRAMGSSEPFPLASIVADWNADGFDDILQLEWEVTAGVSSTGIGAFVAQFHFNERTEERGRVQSLTTEYGGTIVPEFVASPAAGDNGALPYVMRVLASVEDAAGLTRYELHGGEQSDGRFRGFRDAVTSYASGLVSETRYHLEPHLAGAVEHHLQRRRDGTVERLSWFDSEAYSDTVAPWWNPVTKRCDFWIGPGNAMGDGYVQNVDLDALVQDCRDWQGSGLYAGNVGLPSQNQGSTDDPYAGTGSLYDEDLLSSNDPLSSNSYDEPSGSEQYSTSADPAMAPSSPYEPYGDGFAVEDPFLQSGDGFAVEDPFLQSGPAGSEFDDGPSGPSGPAPQEQSAPALPVGFASGDAGLALEEYPGNSTGLPTSVVEPTTPGLGERALVPDETVLMFAQRWAYDVDQRLATHYADRAVGTTLDDTITSHAYGPWDLPNEGKQLEETQLLDRAGSLLRGTLRRNFGDFDEAWTVDDFAAGELRTWQFEFDRGDTTRKVDPEFAETSWELNQCGLPLTRTDAVGRMTTFGYDAACRETDYSFGTLSRTTARDGLGRPDVVTTDAGLGSPAMVEEFQFTSNPAVSNSDVVVVRGGTHVRRESLDDWARLTLLTEYERACASSSCATLDERSVTRAYATDGSLRFVSDPYDSSTASVGGTWTWRDAFGRTELEHRPAPVHVDANPIDGVNEAPDYVMGSAIYRPGATHIQRAGGLSCSTSFNTLSADRECEGASLGSWSFDELGRTVESTDAMGITRNREYDAFGRLEAEEAPCVDLADGTCPDQRWETWTSLAGRTTISTDPAGNQQTVERDGLGRVVEESLFDVGTGMRLTTAQMSYSSSGHQTVQTTDADGNVSVEHVDGLGRTHWTDRPDGASPSQTWDAWGFVSSNTDANGVTTGFARNMWGQPTSITTAIGSTELTHDVAGRTVSEIDADGVETLHGHTWNGLPAWTVRRRPSLEVAASEVAGWVLSETMYDDDGSTLSSWSGGVFSTFENDAFGRPVSACEGDADGTGSDCLVEKAFGWRDDGKLEWDSIVGLMATVHGYNALGWPTSTDLPDGSSRIKEYDTLGRVVYAEDESGVVAEWDFNALGQLVEARLPGMDPQTEAHVYGGSMGHEHQRVAGDGGLWVTWSDFAGRPTRAQAADGTVTEYTYDGDRLVSTHHLDASGNALAHEVQTYDASGRLEMSAGPMDPARFAAWESGDAFELDQDYVFLHEWTAAGRKAAQYGPSDVPGDVGRDWTAFGYEDGFLTSESVAGVFDKTFDYDGDFPRRSVETTTSPDGSAERSVTRSWHRGVYVDFQRSESAEGYTASYFESPDEFGTPMVARNSVEGGGLGGFAVQQSRYEMTTDVRGRVETMAVSLAHGPVGTVTWERYSNGEIASVDADWAGTIEYERHAPDFSLDSVTVTPALAPSAGGTISIPPSGRDGMGRATWIGLINGGISKRTWDTKGQVTDVRAWNGVGERQNRILRYDDRGRLDELQINRNYGGNSKDTYVYDEPGRLVEEVRDRWTGDVRTFTYDHDNAGNRTATHGPDGSSWFQYGEGNQLDAMDLDGMGYVDVEVDGLGGTSFDPRGYELGRYGDGRVASVEGPSVEDPSETVSYDVVRDPYGLPVEFADASGGVWQQVWGNPGSDAWPLAGVDTDGDPILWVAAEGQLLARVEGAVIDDVITDSKGSVVMLGDEYLDLPGAWGDTVTEPNTSDLRFIYAGQQRLPGTPFMSAQHRMYDPTTGRFLSADPLGLAGGAHRFGYANSDPNMFVDPWGLSAGIVSGGGYTPGSAPGVMGIKEEMSPDTSDGFSRMASKDGLLDLLADAEARKGYTTDRGDRRTARRAARRAPRQAKRQARRVERREVRRERKEARAGRRMDRRFARRERRIERLAGRLPSDPMTALSRGWHKQDGTARAEAWDRSLGEWEAENVVQVAGMYLYDSETPIGQGAFGADTAEAPFARAAVEMIPLVGEVCDGSRCFLDYEPWPDVEMGSWDREMACGSLAVSVVTLGAAGRVLSLADAVGGPLRTGLKLGDDLAGVSAFGGLSIAGDYGIHSYRGLSKTLKGTGLQAHHLFEKRFAGVLGVHPADMASVAVTRAEHQVFTNAWRAAIPYGSGTANATTEQIVAAARQIYKEHPALLAALGL
jgi:RHS repeat-associated protein